MEATFHCSICGDVSHRLCTYCTKDACNNHLCQRCTRCSECCGCDMPVTRAEDAQKQPEEALVEEESIRPHWVYDAPN